MAEIDSSSTTATEMETAICRIQDGLNALRALALADKDEVNRLTLSTCVEQMSLAMQGNVQQLLDMVDAQREVSHG